MVMALGASLHAGNCTPIHRYTCGGEKGRYHELPQAYHVRCTGEFQCKPIAGLNTWKHIANECKMRGFSEFKADNGQEGHTQRCSYQSRNYRP